MTVPLFYNFNNNLEWQDTDSFNTKNVFVLDDCSISEDKSLSSDKSEKSEYSTCDPNWRTIIGKFIAVNSVTMSCACDLSPPGMSPYCHLGDGCLDLILVSDCSRLDFLKFLLKTAKGEEVGYLMVSYSKLVQCLLIFNCIETGIFIEIEKSMGLEFGLKHGYLLVY